MENEKDLAAEELENEVQNEEESELEEKDLHEEKVDEIDETLNRLLRLQADFNNYKKRTEKEKKDLVSFGVEKIACDLFPILDNFERALDSQEDRTDSFFQGVEMIYNQLLSLLEKSEIKEINAMHEKFDPYLHYAVSMEESEEHEEGTIINILQKGYKLKDKVIRPTMVIVSK